MKASAIEGRLTATWPTDVHHWLKAASLNTLIERQKVFVFRDIRSISGQRFADGALIRRFWISPARSGLVATPHRTYFQGSTPDLRLERLILGTQDRPRSNRDETLQLLSNITSVLRQARPTFTDIPLQALAANHGSSITIRGNAPAGTENLNSTYRRHGFDEMPKNWRISIIPLDGVTQARASDFKKRISAAASSRLAHPEVALSSIEAARSRLNELEASAANPLPGSLLLLLLPNRSAPPAAPTLDFLCELERHRVPFRRAYADDPLDFSIPDQLPSLLMAAGGRPHAIKVNHRFQNCLTIGLDLSHPTTSAVSRVAATIVDHTGTLVWATRMDVPRNETIDAPTARRLGDGVHSWLRIHGLIGSPLIMLRDGRIPERELISHWLDCFGGNIVVIEVRKRGNPILLETETLALRTPYAVQVQSSNTVLATASAPIDPAAVPEPLKLTWTDQSNRINITATEIANHVMAHCHAPGLGLHSHRLPSAIYWADGIAGADETDLRFRGIPLS